MRMETVRLLGSVISVFTWLVSACFIMCSLEMRSTRGDILRVDGENVHDKFHDRIPVPVQDFDDYANDDTDHERDDQDDRYAHHDSDIHIDNQRDTESDVAELSFSTIKLKPSVTTIIVDSQKLQELYLSTDAVFTDEDIGSMINIMANREGIRLQDAVTGIVNLKLIQRLQFKEIFVLYRDCHQRNSEHHDYGKRDASATIDHSVNDDEYNGECSTQGGHTVQHGGCEPDICLFYRSCILRKMRCTLKLIQMAANQLVMRNLVPFASSNASLDYFLAEAVLLSQYGDPADARRFIANLLEEPRWQQLTAGLLHARALANARSGITESNMALILRDVNAAVAQDESVPSLFRRAAVCLAFGSVFDALEAVEQGLTTDPNFAPFHEIKGAVHFQLQELAQAEDAFRKALELKLDNNIISLKKLGLILYRQGKLSNAISVFKELLKLEPDDSNTLVSIAHIYRQQGDGKKALQYANKAVIVQPHGRVPLLCRGTLYQALGKDLLSLEDLLHCVELHPTHDLCQYHLAIAYAHLGQFFSAVKSMVVVIAGVDVSSDRLGSNTHYSKASYLLNYFRYLHRQLDEPLSALKLELHFTTAFNEGWAKGMPLDQKDYVNCEQKGISPDIPDVIISPLEPYSSDVQDLVCKAVHYGSLMQVQGDSFLPNQRFNLAMGLAAIHVGQYLRRFWNNSTLVGHGTLTWKGLVNISLVYRRLADLETPILWLSDIRDDSTLGYHSEMSFYRGEVKNLRTKSYFDMVFELTRSMIAQQVAMHSVHGKAKRDEVNNARTPEQLIMAAKKFIPAQISTTVPSVIYPRVQYDGTTVVLTDILYGGAYMYMSIPTINTKTEDYDKELSQLLIKLTRLARKIKDNDLDLEKTVKTMMTMFYFFFNLAPFSRGTAAIGFASLLGMFLSINQEITSPLPFGKMIDMEAILSGGSDSFIMGTKHWLKLQSVETSVDHLPSITEVFPSLRSVMELLVRDNWNCVSSIRN